MTSCVTEVVKVVYDESSRTGIVDAIIEDFTVVYPANYDEPCEMGPGLCTARFYLHDEEDLPTEKSALPSFFEEKDLYWEEIDTSDCDSL
jgi:hypothetical protein